MEGLWKLFLFHSLFSNFSIGNILIFNWKTKILLQFNAVTQMHYILCPSQISSFLLYLNTAKHPICVYKNLIEFSGPKLKSVLGAFSNYTELIHLQSLCKTEE